MVDESLHCLFDIFDQDKTGYLERNELKSLLIALGESSSDSRIDRLFNSVDLNKDGRIGFNEFKKLWTNESKKSNNINESTPKYTDSQLKSLFDSCDKDRSGYLERNEIKQLLMDSGEYPTDNRITQLINKVDENRDGRLNFNEFLQLYSNYRSNPSNAQFVDNNNPSRPASIQPAYTRAVLAVNSWQLNSYPSLLAFIQNRGHLNYPNLTLSYSCNGEPNLTVYNGNQLIKQTGYSQWRPQNNVNEFLKNTLLNGTTDNIRRSSDAGGGVNGRQSVRVFSSSPPSL